MKTASPGAARPALLVAAIALTGLVFALTAPTFGTLQNITNIGVQSSMILILACGMAIVIVAGGIDLSVGSVVGASGVLAATLIEQHGLGAGAAVVAVLAMAALLGVLHALIVVLFRVPGIVVTLGSLSAVRGLAFVLTGGPSMRSDDDGLLWIAAGTVAGIPVPILLTLALYAAAHLFLVHTPLGRDLYVTGGNPQAARSLGIRTLRAQVVAYGACAAMAAVAGLVAASRAGSGSPIVGIGWELQAIAIVVLGGASLTGGRARMLDTLLAGLLFGMITNWISLVGISSVQGLIMGLLLIGIVAATTLRPRARPRAGGRT